RHARAGERAEGELAVDTADAGTAASRAVHADGRQSADPAAAGWAPRPDWQLAELRLLQLALRQPPLRSDTERRLHTRRQSDDGLRVRGAVALRSESSGV